EPRLGRREEHRTQDPRGDPDEQRQAHGPAEGDVTDAVAVRGGDADELRAGHESADAHRDAPEHAADEHARDDPRERRRPDMTAEGPDREHARTLTVGRSDDYASEFSAIS